MDPSLDVQTQKTEWQKGKDEGNVKKKKVVESPGKVKATVFWDSKGVLLLK